MVPVTGKLTVLLGPDNGEKVTPAAGTDDHVTEPPPVKNNAVQPSQVFDGPFIFNTGLIESVSVELPLQPGFNGF